MANGIDFETGEKGPGVIRMGPSRGFAVSVEQARNGKTTSTHTTHAGRALSPLPLPARRRSRTRRGGQMTGCPGLPTPRRLHPGYTTFNNEQALALFTITPYTLLMRDATPVCWPRRGPPSASTRRLCRFAEGGGASLGPAERAPGREAWLAGWERRMLSLSRAERRLPAEAVYLLCARALYT